MIFTRHNRIIVALLIAVLFMFSSKATVAQTGDTLAYSNDSISYYSTSGDTIIMHIDSLSGISSCHFLYGNGHLNIVMNLGEDYEFGTNSLHAETGITVIGVDHTGHELARFEKTLSINEDHPEVVFSFDFTDIVYDVKTFKIVLDSYSHSANITNYIELGILWNIDLRWDANMGEITLLNVNTTPTGTNQLTFSWDSECPFSDYEIQVLRLYNNDTTYKNSTDTIVADIDWSKALAIETQSPDKSIKLTIAEGTGYYAWRVRPIGNLYAGGIANYLNWGQWSTSCGTVNDTNITSSNDPYLFFYTQFNDDLNWIYSRIFSEGGGNSENQVRISEKMAFANGLQQVLEEQAHLETRDTVLVTKTVYDYSGRPALKSLPVPVDMKSLGYVDSLLRRTQDTIYTAKHFDKDNNYNDAALVFDLTNNHEPFSYYSDNNPDTQIPDAEGFPFTRTLYQSGTSRVIEQSSPGDTLRLKPLHAKTTRIFYAGASDAELERVFGNEAPAGRSVYKEITVDPNNITSIKYIDQEGKLIATCLGDRPDANPALERIDMTGAGFSNVYTLSDNTIQGNVISAQTTFTVFNESCDFDFVYSIDPDTLEDLCMPFCATCDYKIDILIRDFNHPDSVPIWHDSLIINNTTTGPYSLTNSATLYQGTYLMSREITLLNQDTTLDQTYMQIWVDSVRNRYTHLYDSVLTPIYTMIQTYGSDSMYEYYGITPLISNPDSIALYFQLGNCDSLGIPILTCTKSPCELGTDPLPCWDYFLEQNPDTTWITAPNGTLSIFDYHYTPAGFDSLVNNMLDDVSIPCGAYKCSDIWNCWKTIAGSYQSYLSISQTDTMYMLDLVREFLNCSGRCIQGYQTQPDANFYAHAYELLIYDPATTDSVCKNSIDELGPYDFTGWTPAMYDTLYYCLQAQTDQWWDDCANCYTSTENITQEMMIYETIRDCEERCDDRRGSFQDDVIKMFHADSLYVEGDEFELIHDNIWDTYIFNYGETFSGSYSVTKTEMECMVNGLVDHCISMCQNPDGNDTQQDAFVNAFVNHYELAKPADTSGGGWETVYTNQIKSEPFTLGDVTQYWDSIYGGTKTDSLMNIIQTEDRGYLLVGYSNSVISGNKMESSYINGNDTTYDYWLVKLNRYGTKVWDNDIRANHFDRLTSVKQTCDRGYILGGSSNSDVIADKDDPNIGSNDYWIVKTDSLGNVVTDTVFGGTANDILMDIVEIPGKGYLFAGISKSDSCLYKSQDNIDITLSTQDYWVIRTDEKFNILWDKTLGSTSNDILYSAIQTHDGGFVLAGSSTGDADSTGHKTDNRIGIAGADYWIVKLDSVGNVLWDKTIGGEQNDVATCVIETQYDFDLFISGYSDSHTGSYSHHSTNIGKYDFWLVKTDQFGNYKTDFSYGTDVDEISGSLATSFVKIIETKSGNYLLAGTATFSNYTIDKKAFLAYMIDINGDTLWSKYFYGYAGSYNNFSSVIQSSDRTFMIGGTSGNTSGGSYKSQDAFGTYSKDYWLINIGHTCAADTICIRWISVTDFPVPDFADTLDTISCAQVSAEEIIQLMEAKKNMLIDQKVQAMQEQYQTKCLLPSSITDVFSASTECDKLYHYTLYYYDRAGNLIKTVPPKGVNTVSGRVATNHNLITKYEYNSLGQMVKQITPDGGETNFYYNGLGQIRFSVNARQETDSTFSYTKYDNLGRMIEVGQADSLAGNFLDSLENTTFPNTHSVQRVYTTYTTADSTIQFLDGSYQQNLYNRVSHTTTDDHVGTWFSYDPHGNVKWIVYDIPQLGKQYLAYEYNLVSGTVIKVKYNQGLLDQFYHRYTYDADNRITLAETSRDGIIWDRDASYEYYLHGPLRRVGMGEDKLQGLDYTYTLQGWLKAINLAIADSSLEPGKDGLAGNVHEKYAPDAFGMQLGYYTGDFNRTGSAINSSSEIVPGGVSLYNGNIATWSYHNKTSGKSEGNSYKYDELNRILQSNFQQLNSGTWGAINGSGFQTTYSYDPNGNITGLLRKDESGSVFDSLGYYYVANNSSNRLLRVHDTVDYHISVGDIKGNNPYLYDEIGNLVKDSTNTIDTILWNVYGKVAYVTHNDPAMPDIRFTYDATGNRIMKEVIYPDTMTNETTYYIRDAQGNIMSIYERTLENEIGGYKEIFKLVEQPIYGSSRLGTLANLDSIVKVVHHQGASTETDSINYAEVITENTHLAIQAKWHYTMPSLSYAFKTALSLMNINIQPFIIDRLAKKDNDFTSGSGVLSVLNTIFAGKNSYNICTGEDRFGNVKFTAVTSEKINNVNNVCMLFDHNGVLIPGSQHIKSDWKRKSIAMAKPDSANTWYYFTVGTDNKPYYHVIDFSGITPVIRDSNLVLDNKANYGYKMAIYADYRTGATSYLYMRRDSITVSGTDSTFVMSYPVTTEGIGTGTVSARFLTKDRFGEGDIQVSPDGKYLGVAHYRRKIGFLKGEGQVVLYELSQNGSVLTYKDTVNFDNSTKCFNFDFTTGSKYMYLSTNSYNINISGIPASNNIRRFNIETGSRNDVIVNYSGEIRRGKDTCIYVCTPGLTSIKQITNPNYTTTVTDNTILTETNWTLTGAFPLQPYRIYPKMELLYARNIGDKHYEETDHLGNIRLVFSDRKKSILTLGVPGNFWVDTVTTIDYFPFGMEMTSRSYNTTAYRHGFNGMEKDNEFVNITGSHYSTEFREYDSRICRWLSVDPVIHPWESPYVAFSNNPILNTDPRGDDPDGDSERRKQRKINKFERKERKLARKTGKMGGDLREEMYNRYAKKSWFAVENNHTNTNGGRSWTPTGDLVDVKNNVKVSGTITNTTNDIIDSDVNGIVEPYNINLSPNETVTITAANTRNEANPNIITISQNGATLASGSVQNQGDNVTATFTANTNTQISVNVTMSSANITNVWNSTGTAGAGPTQTISYTSIRVTSTIPKQVFKAPRTIYSGGGKTTSFYNQIKDDPTYNIQY